MPEWVAVIRGEVVGSVPAVFLELAECTGGGLLRHRPPEQQAGQEPVEQALVGAGVDAAGGGGDQRSHGAFPLLVAAAEAVARSTLAARRCRVTPSPQSPDT